MLNNRTSFYLTLFLIAILFVTSCQTRKAIMHGKPIRSLSTNKIIDSALKYRLLPKYYNTKLSVDADWTDDSQTFKVNVRIKKDSIIWTQVQKLIVAFQSIVTLDSVHIMNKLKDTAVSHSIDYLNEISNADLDYYLLQDLIMGNPMALDEEEKYKSPSDTGFYYLSSHRKGKIRRAIHHDRAPKKHPIIYQYKFYPASFKTYMVSITDMNDSTSLSVFYPAYEMVDSVLVPATAEIEATRGLKKIKLSIKYSRTKLNEKTDYPYNVPENYKK